MTRNKTAVLLLGILTVICFSVVTTSAQAVYGSVSGSVTDSAGAAIPDATVTITSVDRQTVDTVTTNSNGFYSKDRLLPGLYNKSPASKDKPLIRLPPILTVFTQRTAYCRALQHQS